MHRLNLFCKTKLPKVKMCAGFGIIFAMIVFCLQCNFSTQSYNMGKLLLPGESMGTIGVGGQPGYNKNDSSYIVYKDSNGTQYFAGEERLIQRNSTGQKLSYCFDYRLGILDKYPLGKGLEFGFHLEAPVQSESNGSIVLEIDLRSGLPAAVVYNSVYHHNIGAGWITGMWIDNGVYAEYAAGLEYKYFIPYSNIRLLYTATDQSEYHVSSEPSFLKRHYQYFNIRQCVGLGIKLPPMFILPDLVVPEVTIGYPNYNRFQNFGFTYHIGLRWLNGF